MSAEDILDAFRRNDGRFGVHPYPLSEAMRKVEKKGAKSSKSGCVVS